MKKFKIIKSKKYKNEYVIVFSPEINSVNKELNNIIKNYKFKEKITIKMDLITFVGDRPERFVKLDIKESEIIDNSLIKGEFDQESMEITIEEYSNLSQILIDRIYPVYYRKIIISYIKKNMMFEPLCY